MNRSRALLACGIALLTVGNASGCGGSDSGGDGAQGGSGASSGNGGSGGAVLDGVNGQHPTAGTDGGGISVTPVVPVLPGDECAGDVFAGEGVPLNMIVMMDRSVSMGDSEPQYLIPGGGTKWVAVRQGFEDFVALAQTTGMGMGIDFFGQASCDPADYSTPEVPIGTLPGVGPDILAAYDSWTPGDITQMGPALDGAIQAAQEWALANPGSPVIVVLVTDGVPNGCGAVPTPSDEMRVGVQGIADVAAAGLSGTPSIGTFVLGIEGQEVSIADFEYAATTIAQAGGSDPVIIQANDNLATEFAAALNQIRAMAAPPCSYRVPLPPSGQDLDLGRVNVVLEPPGRDAEGILNVPSADDCQYGGWYYNPPASPTSIELCPNTCEAVSTLNGAGFSVLFGCATVTGPVT